MNIHKNARLTPQGRLLLVERITEAGWGVVQAAQAAGISVRQSYRWLARYRAEGAAGLGDRSSAPHQLPAPYCWRPSERNRAVAAATDERAENRSPPRHAGVHGWRGSAPAGSEPAGGA